jgi:hypothetical protein
MVYRWSQDIFTDGLEGRRGFWLYWRVWCEGGRTKPPLRTAKTLGSGMIELAVVDGKRYFGLKIKLADEGAAEPDQDSIIEKLELHFFTDQGTADKVALTLHADTAIFPYETNMIRVRVFPGSGLLRGFRCSAPPFPVFAGDDIRSCRDGCPVS